ATWTSEEVHSPTHAKCRSRASPASVATWTSKEVHSAIYVASQGAAQAVPFPFPASPTVISGYDKVIHVAALKPALPLVAVLAGVGEGGPPASCPSALRRHGDAGERPAIVGRRQRRADRRVERGRALEVEHVLERVGELVPARQMRMVVGIAVER